MANLFSENPIVEIVAVPGRDGTEITIDDRLSDTSENPVQNKVVKQAIDNAVTVTQDYATQAVETAYGQLDEAKQDVLVNSGAGQNIKTINNESVLGKGNLEISTEVETDNELSDTSVNPVKNYVIKNAIDTVKNDSEHYTDVEVGRTASIINAEIQTIEGKIPAQASTENQLADKKFVNSSINTATSTFRGTFDTLAALQATDGDKNDYAFYEHTDSAGNTVYDRYKYVGLPETRVPEGYLELYSVGKNGVSDSYINTEIIVKPNYSLYAKMVVNNVSVYSNPIIFGVTDTQDNSFKLIKSFRNVIQMVSNSICLNGNAPTDGVYILELKDNTYYLNGTYVGSITTPDIENEYPLYLLGSNNKGALLTQDYGIISYCSFKMWDDTNNLLIDLVPCKRNSDNLVGMYDLVTNQFLTSPNGTAFVSTPLSTDKWAYEYSLNNSSFTAEQWATINSGLAQHVTSVGYDANVTQVLKNINGVIQWVTEQ